MHGISITRAPLPEKKLKGSVPLVYLFEVISEEIARTKNPFFGRADLELLEKRLLTKLLTCVVE